VHHLYVVFLRDQRQRLFFHIHKSGRRDLMQRLTAHQHHTAGCAVLVADQGDVTALVIQRRGDNRKRIDQQLRRVGDENQVFVVVLPGQVFEHATGAAEFGLIALDLVHALISRARADRLRRVSIHHDPHGERIERRVVRELRRVHEPVIQDRSAFIDWQIEDRTANRTRQLCRAHGSTKQHKCAKTT